MRLNIKNPEAHRRARKIALETGDSLTKVVIDSLCERCQKLFDRRSKPGPEESVVLALAKSVNEPLLFKGGDFSRTDTTSVRAAR